MKANEGEEEDGVDNLKNGSVHNGVDILGRSMQGFLEKGIQTPMAQGRATKLSR